MTLLVAVWLIPWRGHSLRGEVILVLLSKSLVLMVIWWLFFSDPVDETLNGEDIAERLLGAASVQATDKVAGGPSVLTQTQSKITEQEEMSW
ncbi:MAG TPA: hypothetical protein ENI97_09415 [Gammaproteobacteria bacterium]|nr:hypothetical protein [Gammaproteobacteria bacterium]